MLFDIDSGLFGGIVVDALGGFIEQRQQFFKKSIKCHDGGKSCVFRVAVQGIEPLEGFGQVDIRLHLRLLQDKTVVKAGVSRNRAEFAFEFKAEVDAVKIDIRFACPCGGIALTARDV